MRRSGQISALHRELLADIAEFDRAEGWRGDGAVSIRPVPSVTGHLVGNIRYRVRSVAYDLASDWATSLPLTVNIENQPG